MVKKYFPRKSYMQRIEPFIDKGLVKVLIGQRRTGKSYLLFQIIDEIKTKNPNANIIYINKENYEFDEIKNYKDLNQYIISKYNSETKNYLFIDEIQDIEFFEKSLRHFNAEGLIDIYCTGSNANLLSGELASVLSGRVILIKVYGLSYLEFLEFQELENNTESLNRFMNYGGLPYLINVPNDENVVYEYLKNIFTSIIYKDVVSRNNIRNIHFLENLVRFVANNTGNILSAKKISDYLKSQNLKISPQTVLDYLQYLQTAFLVYKVKRTDITGKKVFEIGEKYYFEDWGLKNSLVGFKQTNINQIIENVIFIHLKIHGFSVLIGQTGDKEIDFVCERSGEIIYIQAAYIIADEKVKEREFGNLLDIRNNWRKIVVSLDEYLIKNYEGIEHIHLKDFLSNFK